MSAATRLDERAIRAAKQAARDLPLMPDADRARLALITSTARQAPEQEARPA